MKKLLSGITLGIVLCGLYATAQQPHVTQTLPSATVKLNGASGGGGTGTGFTYDAGEGAWIFTPPSGASDTRILSDGISLQDAAGVDIMAMDATLGATTYVAGRLAADAIEVRGSSSLAASGTITATNIQCSTSGGAVVGTLNATAGNVGRFVYVTRDGANTCTIGVASGQTLDGVTDGTTTVPSAGWKTFVQTTSTAWVTAGSYPVTGTLSGLTAPFIPVAASATSVANSPLSVGTAAFDGSEPQAGTYIDFPTNSSAGALYEHYRLWTSDITRHGSLVVTNGAGTPWGITASSFNVFGAGAISQNTASLVGTVRFNAVGFATPAMQFFDNANEIGWGPTIYSPNTQIKRDANATIGIYDGGSTYGQLNVGTIQQSYSKALVDATATDVVQVPVASNSYEGFTMDYTIFATDATDYQVRQGSVPVAVLNVGGTETCVFGTATEAVNASAGTLTVAFDCTAGTNTVMVRANANTSLASTTVFTIQQRINLTSGTAVLVPQ